MGSCVSLLFTVGGIVLELVSLFCSQQMHTTGSLVLAMPRCFTLILCTLWSCLFFWKASFLTLSLFCLLRGVHRLLDSRPGHPPPWRLLRQLQRAHLRKVLPASGRVQLSHEPHHLLLPWQRDERHLQADPVLPAAGERQWNDGGGIRPVGVVHQPHGARHQRYAPPPSPPQWALSSIKEGCMARRLIHTAWRG